MSYVDAGGMTFGPRLVELSAASPPTRTVAVEERSFQTSSGSSESESASDSSTSVRVVGVPSSPAFGTVPRFQVTSPPLTPADPAPLPGRAIVYAVPSGAGMLTVTPEKSWSLALVTVTRDGYVSPGFTQPTEETKLLSTRRVLGALTTLTVPVPACCADHSPVASSV